MVELTRNVTVIPQDQNQAIVTNTRVSAHVRKMLMDVNAVDVHQHSMVLDKMAVLVS